MNRNIAGVLLAAACMATTLSTFAQSSAVMSSAETSSEVAGGKAAAKTDRELSRAVRRALGKAQGFDVSGVFVKARGGAVTLSGTVRSGDQIRQAEEVARTVQGVNSVQNRLTLFHGGNG
jgi:osmotically-inducible protein OsmY